MYNPVCIRYVPVQGHVSFFMDLGLSVILGHYRILVHFPCTQHHFTQSKVPKQCSHIVFGKLGTCQYVLVCINCILVSSRKKRSTRSKLTPRSACALESIIKPLSEYICGSDLFFCLWQEAPAF